MELPGLRDPRRDGPLRLPKAVAKRVPKWKNCGNHRCGDHHHPPNRFSQGNTAEPFVTQSWQCTVCGEYDTPPNMHALACGHVLCLECLDCAAQTICRRMADSRMEIDSCLIAVENLVREASRGGHDEARALELFHAAEAAGAEAWEKAGFTCCGVISGIWEYLHCIEPAMAKKLWVWFYFLLAPRATRLQCGWPDCRMVVPMILLYDTIKGPRWHCVICGGNSQGGGWDTSFPAR